MKRAAALMLVALLLVPALALAAKPPAMDAVVGLINGYHTEHQALHTLSSVTMEEDGQTIEIVFPEEAPASLLGCVEVYLPSASLLPTTADGLHGLFMSALQTAMAVTVSVEDAQVMDVDRYTKDYAEALRMGIPSTDWWRVGRNKTFDMIFCPILLLGEEGLLIDNQVYTLVAYTTDSLTGIWICADQDIVRAMLEKMAPPEADGTHATDTLLSWLAGDAPAPVPPAEADAKVERYFEFERNPDHTD